MRHFLAQLAVETGRLPEVKVAALLMRKLCYENEDNLMAGVVVGGQKFDLESSNELTKESDHCCLRVSFLNWNLMQRSNIA